MNSVHTGRSVWIQLEYLDGREIEEVYLPSEIMSEGKVYVLRGTGTRQETTVLVLRIVHGFTSDYVHVQEV